MNPASKIELKIDGYKFDIHSHNSMISLTLPKIRLVYLFEELEGNKALDTKALEKYPFKKALNKYRNLTAFL